MNQNNDKLLKKIILIDVVRIIVLLIWFSLVLAHSSDSELDTQETIPLIDSRLSQEESNTILNESLVFIQILSLYAMEALEKPSDLRLCALEMFRLKPNEKSCRDQYSSWYPKEERDLFKSEMEGKFGGIGLELSDRNGQVIVISPINETPAFRAGFKPEDIVVKVDDKPVLNVIDAVASIRGQPGTAVKVTITRKGQEISFNMIREIIIVSAISTEVINNSAGAIGYIKVKTFSKVMPEEFRSEIIKILQSQGINKFVLDFRNNPGGPLNNALDILYDFANPKDIFITIRERKKETIYDTNYVALMLKKWYPPGMFLGLKIILLINNGSASASEIVAAAMKDWGFPIVGVRSFGKGVGQTLFPLSNDSELRLTTFEFFGGNSKTKINEVGVIPNYEIADEDKQLEKAIELLSR